jgi:DNA polymerase elongation subunit (family B)
MLADKRHTFSDKGPPPPGAVVAARRQLEDPNNEAQYGDRIPYIIARGAPQERLVDRAVAPEEFYDRNNSTGLIIFQGSLSRHWSVYSTSWVPM